MVARAIVAGGAQVGHGWEGVVLKLFRGKDFVFIVTGAEQVTEPEGRVAWRA